MRISDWSSDVCSSDLHNPDYIKALEILLSRLRGLNADIDGIWVDSKVASLLPIDQRVVRPSSYGYPIAMHTVVDIRMLRLEIRRSVSRIGGTTADSIGTGNKRSEEHTSELQSLMRISYDVLCLKKKN